MKNLIKAVHNVMEECKGIEKSMTVGYGRNAYSGVSDKDVKILIGSSMRKNGLAIFPVAIEPKFQIDRWDAVDYNGNPTTKQSVFTEVVATYKLVHESGESIDIAGYGHGVDPQDKAAGKATTYALKYALLYTFMVATGHIDDSDATHSDDVAVPKSKKKELPKQVEVKQPTQGQFEAMINAVKSGKGAYVKQQMPKYKFTKTQQEQLDELLK